MAGCTNPDHPPRNLHPQKRYEVTITTDAPGVWDHVKAIVFYDVTNLECTPFNSFVGVHTRVPLGQDTEIDLTQVDENTWHGYFYRDLFRDEDYYGLGVCQWDGNVVAPDFVVHGRSFGSGQWVRDALEQPQVEYFRKSDFLDGSPSPYKAPGFLVMRPEYAKDPGAFFPITVTVKEAKP